MSINVSTLRESRQNALIRLSKIQSLQISDNYLDYQVESYINLKQLIESNVINKFSLGQLSVIVFNIVVHLIKVYQKIYISQLTLENVIFNQELKVKFINLHEEDNLQTYQQNLQIIIDLIQQLFLKYQEVIIEQYKVEKQITICKKIELATFYSNKILTLLQSKRHFKKLKLFVQNQVDKGLIIDNLLKDNLTEEREFRNIFSNSSLSNSPQRNSQQTSQQLKPTQQQSSDQSQTFRLSQQEQTTIYFQQQNLIEKSPSVSLNQYQQSNLVKESASVQYNKFQQESQSLQNNQQQQQEQFNPQQLQMTDFLQQEPENLVPLQPYISEQDQNNVSQFKKKTINPDLYAFFVQNIAEINNEDFKASLLDLFLKYYKELNWDQADYICKSACQYFNYIGQYCQEFLNLYQNGQVFVNQLYFMLLEKLILLCYDNRLLEKPQNDGWTLCQSAFEEQKNNLLNQFQQEQQQQNDIY